MSILEPRDPKTFTKHFDSYYSRFSGIYDILVSHTRIWQSVLNNVIPHIKGPRVLEASFGTGWLITQYASRFDTYGIDFNEKMIRITSRNLHESGETAHLQRANVEHLPYKSESFDTIVNTAAFSGYPRADIAMSEFRRVLKPGGRLVLIDVSYPEDRNIRGMFFCYLTELTGDILRDMGQIFTQHGFEFEHKVIGGAGAIHMYIAQKKVYD